MKNVDTVEGGFHSGFGTVSGQPIIPQEFRHLLHVGKVFQGLHLAGAFFEVLFRKLSTTHPSHKRLHNLQTTKNETCCNTLYREKCSSYLVAEIIDRRIRKHVSANAMAQHLTGMTE